MAYIVFARKWRPKNFDEIIGQDHITQTLKNAIKNDRVAHAYIFTGPRGIGKTSAARIFAKALNCKKGPTQDPCGKCVSCKEISESRNLDVLEIDGASNRGIDEIRTLRENVKFAPTAGKFKIYIIDEVHQITSDGFNALLKTLEEPPPHVKFIFATTHPHKVPPTILSRCHRFDFRKISTDDIIKKLKFISKQENLKIADNALFAIARIADGSLRDAESILDQLASFSDTKIEIADVTQIFGMLNEETLFEIVDAIINKDASKALRTIDSLIKEGKDVSLVALELLKHFRDLLVAKVGKDLEQLIELPGDAIKKLSKQSESLTVEDLLYAVNVISNTYDVIKRSNLGRVPLEMAIVKLAKKDSIHSLGEILNKISEIDKKTVDGSEEDRISEKHQRTAKPLPPPKEETNKTNSAKKDIKEEAAEEAPTVEYETSKNSAGLEQIKNIWPNLLQRLRVKRMSIASCLLEGTPISCENGKLTLGFPSGYSFHKEVLEREQNKKFIEEALLELLDARFALEFVIVEGKKTPGGTKQDRSDPGSQSLDEGAKGDADYHKDQIVDSALEMFNGKVIKRSHTDNDIEDME